MHQNRFQLVNLPEHGAQSAAGGLHTRIDKAGELIFEVPVSRKAHDHRSRSHTRAADDHRPAAAKCGVNLLFVGEHCSSHRQHQRGCDEPEQKAGAEHFVARPCPEQQRTKQPAAEGRRERDPPQESGDGRIKPGLVDPRHPEEEAPDQQQPDKQKQIPHGDAELEEVLEGFPALQGRAEQRKKDGEDQGCLIGEAYQRSAHAAGERRHLAGCLGNRLDLCRGLLMHQHPDS